MQIGPNNWRVFSNFCIKFYAMNLTSLVTKNTTYISSTDVKLNILLVYTYNKTLLQNFLLIYPLTELKLL